MQDIFTSKVEAVTQEATLRDVAAAMRDAQVGAIPVLDDQLRAVGIVTDRDIVLRAVADGGDPSAVTAGEVMTPSVISCNSDQPIEEAAQLMEGNQVRRLLVLDEETNRAIGVVSLGDIALHCREPLAAEAIREVSRPSKSEAATVQ